MKKLIFGMLTALVACTSWATASVTWSLGGAADGEPAAGVWVGSSEGGEQIMSGHLYLCFTPAGEGSQLETWITQLTTLSSEGTGGLDGAGVSAMNTFLAANSQWNGYSANNPNFSANVYSGTGGAFGTPVFPTSDNPSPVKIDGINQNGSYDVVAVIFDTQDITADSQYAVIKGFGEADFYTDGTDLGRLECGFYSEWYEDIEHGMFAPNNVVDAQWHTVGAPEPTSGLLLLLGVAGLALRRPASRKRYAVTSKRA